MHPICDLFHATTLIPSEDPAFIPIHIVLKPIMQLELFSNLSVISAGKHRIASKVVSSHEIPKTVTSYEKKPWSMSTTRNKELRPIHALIRRYPSINRLLCRIVDSACLPRGTDILFVPRSPFPSFLLLLIHEIQTSSALGVFSNPYYIGYTYFTTSEQLPSHATNT